MSGYRRILPLLALGSLAAPAKAQPAVEKGRTLGLELVGEARE